jgi:hypothetical protein
MFMHVTSPSLLHAVTHLEHKCVVTGALILSSFPLQSSVVANAGYSICSPPPLIASCPLAITCYQQVGRHGHK